jgi:predicted amidohydrolase
VRALGFAPWCRRVGGWRRALAYACPEAGPREVHRGPSEARNDVRTFVPRVASDSAPGWCSGVRIGMGQMRVEPGAPERNLERAAAMVRRAAAAGCQAVVLPECLDLGWTYPGTPALARPIPGPHAEALCRAARESGLLVAAGLAERDGPRVYNAAVLIAADGQILLKHRKIHELEIARDVYATGTSLAVADSALGRVALLVCADNFPQSLDLARAAALMGARLILSPCAWAVPADHDPAAQPYGALWRTAYGTLARERGLAVVGVSNVGPLTAGPWAGRRCIGCSLAVGPGGRILAQGPYGEDAEALVPVEVELRGGADADDAHPGEAGAAGPR